MALKRVRAHNPATVLHIINGGRMTRRKRVNRRKTSNAVAVRSHRSTAAKVVPNRRRRTRRVASNPAVHRRRRRAHNPALKGVVMMAAWAAVGNWATNIVAGFIPIQASGWMGVGVRLGAAWLAGTLAGRFTSPANAQMIAVGGAMSAAQAAFNLLMGQMRGITGGLFSSAPAPQPVGVGDYVGMGDLSSLDDISPAPDYYLQATSQWRGGLPAAKKQLGDITPAPDYYEQAVY